VNQVFLNPVQWLANQLDSRIAKASLVEAFRNSQTKLITSPQIAKP